MNNDNGCPNRRGLVVLAGPAVLMQFLWYREYAAEPTSWDALIIEYGGSETVEKMMRICRNSEVFKNIIKSQRPIATLSMSAKIKMMLRMIGFFSAGRANTFAKRYINGQGVDYDSYDEIVVASNDTILSGCVIRLSQSKRTVLLEDGTADYIPKRRWCGWGNLTNPSYFLGMIISFMGYGTCVPGYYKLNNFRFCIRYSTLPDKLEFKEYAEIHTLFEGMENRETAFFETIGHFFSVDVKSLPSGEYDLLLFTAPYKSNENNFPLVREGIHNCIHSWIKSNYGANVRILVKKHPRDIFDYSQWNDLNLKSIESSIPGEILIPLYSKIEVVLMSPSALMFELERYQVKYTVINPERFVNNLVAANMNYQIDFFNAPYAII